MDDLAGRLATTGVDGNSNKHTLQFQIDGGVGINGGVGHFSENLISRGVGINGGVGYYLVFLKRISKKFSLKVVKIALL